ncbi:hypothetical protein EIP86_011140 [Pleurotus ostreatoroseus]|nr:hypothetical protein EIP86_011140 [Pleurotus ostreatoroseus]
MSSHIVMDDPEKGTSEALETLQLAATVKDESKEQTNVSVKAVIPSTKGMMASKPKSKINWWQRIQLWFNTYRYVPHDMQLGYLTSSVYHRKFYTIVCTVNGVGLFLAAINVWQYPRQYTGAFVLGNLVTAILMRNELFGRFLYLFVTTCFAKWPPLWFRLGCTSVLQHIGGIHSGCATSGFAWLIFRVTLIFINHKNNHDAVLIMGVITNLAVAISIARW